MFWIGQSYLPIYPNFVAIVFDSTSPHKFDRYFSDTISIQRVIHGTDRHGVNGQTDFNRTFFLKKALSSIKCDLWTAPHCNLVHSRTNVDELMWIWVMSSRKQFFQLGNIGFVLGVGILLLKRIAVRKCCWKNPNSFICSTELLNSS